jgi:hypothetical protein
LCRWWQRRTCCCSGTQLQCVMLHVVEKCTCTACCRVVLSCCGACLSCQLDVRHDAPQMQSTATVDLVQQS